MTSFYLNHFKDPASRNNRFVRCEGLRLQHEFGGNTIQPINRGICVVCNLGLLEVVLL